MTLEQSSADNGMTDCSDGLYMCVVLHRHAKPSWSIQVSFLQFILCLLHGQLHTAAHPRSNFPYNARMYLQGTRAGIQVNRQSLGRQRAGQRNGQSDKHVNQYSPQRQNIPCMPCRPDSTQPHHATSVHVSTRNAYENHVGFHAPRLPYSNLYLIQYDMYTAYIYIHNI